MTHYGIDQPWARGNPTLLDWMNSQGIVPVHTIEFEFDEQAMEVTVVQHKLKDGKPYAEGNEVATHEFTKKVTTKPPTHDELLNTRRGNNDH